MQLYPFDLAHSIYKNVSEEEIEMAKNILIVDDAAFMSHLPH